MTVGTKGAHYTVNSKGTRTKSVGIPGTGLSYVDVKNPSKNGSKSSEETHPTTRKEIAERNKKGCGIGCLSLLAIILAIIALANLFTGHFDNFFGVLLFSSIILAIVSLFWPKLAFWTKKKTRGRAFLGYLILAIIFFIGFGLTSNSESANDNQKMSGESSISEITNSPTDSSISDGSADSDSSSSKTDTDETDTSISESKETSSSSANTDSSSAKPKTESTASVNVTPSKSSTEQPKKVETAPKKAASGSSSQSSSSSSGSKQSVAVTPKKSTGSDKTNTSANKPSSSSTASSNSGNSTTPFQNNPADDKEQNTQFKGKIKGNANSKIYHVPGGAYYDRTVDNIVWFDTEQDAINAGYRKSKR